MIRRKDINSRLISEIIEHDGFRSLLADAEIYVNGFVAQSIDEYNTLMELARKKIAEKADDTEDISLKTLEHIKVAQQEYFGRLLADELMNILEEIKKKHRKDKDTSDGAFTTQDYEKMFRSVKVHRSSPFKGLEAAVLEALHIKPKDRDLTNAQSLLEKDEPVEEDIAELVGQSPLVEPIKRKRRKR